ncbi:hypothetical protein ABT160_33200 [Streptomyces sp. NPDC001941]|uniref:hypothetical protein n=1 Tax=Streptomyces sp. NPDC001941 TaxID=3154659 RepID=UPI00332660D6
MSRAVVGMFVGMALAFAGYFGGFLAFLLVAALGGAGYAVGTWLDGGGQPRDLRDLFERGRR